LATEELIRRAPGEPEPREPWYAAGLAFECRRCGGCCGGFPGYVWIDRDEIAALASYLGLAPDAFLATYARRVGGRYTLREVAGWNCVMLRDGACSVYDARPVQCRTFPFWDEHLGSPRDWAAAARRCPGMNSGRLYSADEIDQLRRARARAR